MAAAAALPDAPLKAAVESAVHGLLTDLFAERPSGRVQWVQGSNEVIFNFPNAVAALDSEYLVVRPADPGTDGFARTVGVVRIAEVQGAMARAVALWSDGPLLAGDHVVAPERVTILLRPIEAAVSTEAARDARKVDRWLELELLAERRVRVIRADASAEERWRRHGIDTEREYAVVMAPLLVQRADGAELLLSLRSLFTGQTLASSRAIMTVGAFGAERASRPSLGAGPVPPADHRSRRPLS